MDEPDLDIELSSSAKEVGRRRMWTWAPGEPSRIQEHVDRIVGHPRVFPTTFEIEIVDDGWEKNPRQTDMCQHPNRKGQGCWLCCEACNHATHTCGGCGNSTDHGVNTCNHCREQYFIDPEDQED